MADKQAATKAMTPTVLKALAEIAATLGDAEKDISNANYGLARGKVSSSKARLEKALDYFGFRRKGDA